jgi:uncharacterized membrane protein YadS
MRKPERVGRISEAQSAFSNPALPSIAYRGAIRFFAIAPYALLLSAAVHRPARADHDIKAARQTVPGFAAGWIAAARNRKAPDISAGNLLLGCINALGLFLRGGFGWHRDGKGSDG